MNIIAYILFICQALALYSIPHTYGVSISTFFALRGVWFMLGYFFPTFLGIWFLRIHRKNKLRKKHAITKRALRENPEIPHWTCAKCKTHNYMEKHICPVCGVSRQWSDDQT